MRAWLDYDDPTGGTWVTTPLDPPIEVAEADWADPEVPESQTEVVAWHGPGPINRPSSGAFRPVDQAPLWGTNPTWVCIDFDATDAPAGTRDLGDPSVEGWATTLLTNQQKSQLRSELGGTTQWWQQDRTRGEMLRLFTGGPLTVFIRRVRAGWD